jgi:hypothetical protein
MVKGMTESQAKGVYGVLVSIAGANIEDEESFVSHFSQKETTNEWRFRGHLGFGGKFRYPSISVDCYPEDSTPEREVIVEKTNAALAEFR